MENEQWRSIPGFEGFYEISSLGRVRSQNKVLKPYIRDLYLAVWLHKNGERFQRNIHTLVATTFWTKMDDKYVVCHRNGKYFDNRADNLRWGTRSSNAQDMLIHGTCFNANKEVCPRGHDLVEGNLRNRHWRECLACHRTRTYLIKNPKLDFQTVADLCFKFKESPGRLKRKGVNLWLN